MEYLYRKLMVAWDEAIAGGVFAMTGEFGCYQYTQHTLVMDWLEDYLRLWKERNMEWMMLCGWTTTWISSGVTPKRCMASINSSPLFIIVAESTEIFAPILQLGCFTACSGVTFSVS